MSQSKTQWVIKLTNGQVKGPYSTEGILRLIKEGAFLGQEMVSKMPDGQWTQISREPLFYDQLLEALEVGHVADPHVTDKMEAETVVQQKTSKAPKKEADPNSTLPGIDFGGLKKTMPEKEKPKFPQPNADIKKAARLAIQENSVISRGPDIELKNISHIKDKNESNQKLILIIAALVIVLGGVYLFWDEPESTFEKVHLLAVGKSTAPLPADQVKQKYFQAIQGLEKGTFNSYSEAENNLVQLIQADSQNLVYRGLLCVVYNQLWPFVKQDSQDLNAVATLTRNTKSLSLLSPYGQTCESVALLTSNRYKEARSVIESTLDGGGIQATESDTQTEKEQKLRLKAFLYQFKGELLQAEHDYDGAINYYKDAQLIYPSWTHPHLQLAKAYRQKKEFGNAVAELRTALAANPANPEALYLLGTIEHRDVKKSDSAFNSLQAAYNMKDKATSHTSAEGLYSLAEIYLSRNEKSKAREAAEAAIEISPSSAEIRQLVVRLGGSGKSKNTGAGENELIFVGDQYYRQGDFLASQAEYKSAFDINPKNGLAAVKVAKSLWALNQSFDALAWLKKALKAEPKLISAYVLQADYYSQRFDFLQADLALRSAVRIAPNNYEVLRGYALVDLRKNNFDSAINYGLRSLRVYDADIDTYVILAKANAMRAATMQPSNNKEIEKRNAYSKDAIKYSSRAIEVDSANVDAQITYGFTQAKINGLESGIAYLTDLTKKFSYVIEYKVAIADLLMSEERFSQAKEILDKVLVIDPKNKKALIGLGLCYKALGLDRQAKTSFLNAAVLDPTDAEPLFQAAKLALETNLKDKDESQKTLSVSLFSRVIGINPNYPKAHYYLGKAYYFEGDWDAALQNAAAEKKLNPNVADAYILTAEILFKKALYSDCAGEYSIASKLRPDGADIYVKTAECYRLAGSLDLAEDMLSLAKAKESGYADIYREQGYIFLKKNAKTEAVAAFSKYLNLSPNATDRKAIENLVQNLSQ